MSGGRKSLQSRVWGGIVGLLPGGGIGDDAPPTDVDWRRHTDTVYWRAVLKAKSQMSANPDGGPTSYGPVERNKKDDSCAPTSASAYSRIAPTPCWMLSGQNA